MLALNNKVIFFASCDVVHVCMTQSSTHAELDVRLQRMAFVDIALCGVHSTNVACGETEIQCCVSTNNATMFNAWMMHECRLWEH